MRWPKNRYRVVRDSHLGFEAQVKFWYCPFFWYQLDRRGRGVGTNTCSTVAEARDVARLHRHGPCPQPASKMEVVEYLEDI